MNRPTGKSEYAKKFMDPRWQEKRLRIMDRDGFRCQHCFEITDPPQTLNVHHRYYRAWGTDPWDYPDEALVTLCEPCHEEETERRPVVQQALIEAVLGGQYQHWTQVVQFATALKQRQAETESPWQIFEMLCFLLDSPARTAAAVQEYQRSGPSWSSQKDPADGRSPSA